MFDKITIKATIDTADIETIVLRNYLEECTEGDEVYTSLPLTPTLTVVSSRFAVTGYGVRVPFASSIPRERPGNWITAAR